MYEFYTIKFIVVIVYHRQLMKQELGLDTTTLISRCQQNNLSPDSVEIVCNKGDNKKGNNSKSISSSDIRGNQSPHFLKLRMSLILCQSFPGRNLQQLPTQNNKVCATGQPPPPPPPHLSTRDNRKTAPMVTYPTKNTSDFKGNRGRDERGGHNNYGRTRSRSPPDRYGRNNDRRNDRKREFRRTPPKHNNHNNRRPSDDDKVKKPRVSNPDSDWESEEPQPKVEKFDANPAPLLIAMNGGENYNSRWSAKPIQPPIPPPPPLSTRPPPPPPPVLKDETVRKDETRQQSGHLETALAELQEAIQFTETIMSHDLPGSICNLRGVSDSNDKANMPSCSTISSNAKIMDLDDPFEGVSPINTSVEMEPVEEKIQNSPKKESSKRRRRDRDPKRTRPASPEDGEIGKLKCIILA